MKDLLEISILASERRQGCASDGGQGRRFSPSTGRRVNDHFQRGQLAGSVSGGCVETAVFEEAQEVLRVGCRNLIRYGITDEMAWDVGLACGGTIEVYVEPLPADHE